MDGRIVLKFRFVLISLGIIVYYLNGLIYEHRLSILEEEASRNKLDPDVVRLFIDDELFKEVIIEKKQEG